ncbi:MAG TPA: response regulator [Desulfotignum sp.]|jgi:DNA-binding NtrC family response regulator|nr:response regulator [Desulfotignum sp.]
MKILLVDDEIKFINMLARRLSLRGLDADVASSGDQALEKAAQTSYDIAVLDMKMPGMSGFTLKRKLHDMLPDIQFIFVTGHGTIEKNGNQDDSEDIFLAKPLNIDTLIDTIRQRHDPDDKKGRP